MYSIKKYSSVLKFRLRYLVIVLLLSAFKNINAQSIIKGTVKDNTNETLPGVSVIVAGTGSGTTTDINGKFELNTTQSFPLTLVFSFVGFTTDSLFLHHYNGKEINIALKKSVTLKAVDIKSKRESTTISTINPINTTTLGKEELLKAACCNLSESFETNPTVDASFTDAVTGAKQVQILGLDGVYSQIQTELVPFIRGLSSNYGLAFIPGPFIESIQINKGAGSVITGHESISGQVNIELKKPSEAERFALNGYINNEQRMELNTQVAGKINKHIYTELLSHGSMLQNKVDHNKDGFLDSPLYQQLNLYNRWHFIYNQVFEAQAGIRFVYDDKQGGQNQFSYANDYGTQTLYGIGIKNKMFDAFAKTGFLFKEKPWKSIGIIQSVRYHEQESYFGLKTFDGIQKSYYANAISQGIIGDTRHTIKNGVAFVYNDYAETFSQLKENTIETTPGFFSEYTYNNSKNISMVAGVRYDYHNEFGSFVTPRIHFKYNFTQLSALRLSAGRGWRTARIFAENPKIFPSSRYVVAANNLKPEDAWNYGLSYTRKFRMFKRDASFNADVFRTDFINQVVVDMEDIHTIRFYNLNGTSYANSVSLEINFTPIEHFDVRLAYKFNDVKTTYSGTLREKPLSPRDRALVNVAYKSNNQKWKFDFTTKYNGVSRIPAAGVVHHGYQVPSKGDAFIQMMSQITFVQKNFEVYVGGENLTDYTQHHAIIEPENPFGDSFDASLVWGPLMGRTIYMGFRYFIK